MHYLTAHLATLRFDWAAINTGLVLAMLGATTLLHRALLRGMRLRPARAQRCRQRGTGRLSRRYAPGGARHLHPGNR